VNRDGLIYLSSRVGKALKLAVGDVVAVAQDRTETWLQVRRRHDTTTGRHSGVCRSTYKNGRSMLVNSRQIAAALFHITAATEETRKLHLYCGEPFERDGQRCVPIIVRATAFLT